MCVLGKDQKLSLSFPFSKLGCPDPVFGLICLFGDVLGREMANLVFLGYFSWFFSLDKFKFCGFAVKLAFLRVRLVSLLAWTIYIYAFSSQNWGFLPRFPNLSLVGAWMGPFPRKRHFLLFFVRVFPSKSGKSGKSHFSTFSEFLAGRDTPGGRGPPRALPVGPPGAQAQPTGPIGP